MHQVTRVKICGITTLEDALLAIRLGAHSLGFLVDLLYDSDDALTAEQAAKILASLPPFVSGTLVTHQADPRAVLELCRVTQPHVLQLHGPFPVDRIGEVRAVFPAVKIVKAVHVDGGPCLEIAREAARHADAVLLDTKTATRIGGTGQVHDWSISRRIRDDLAGTATPVILAGGLDPTNVARAIAAVGPYAVDVNSGVSVRRGKKSAALIASFIEAVNRPSTEPA